jgi:tetratricopeptide (TPR) repeat protein
MDWITGGRSVLFALFFLFIPVVVEAGTATAEEHLRKGVALVEAGELEGAERSFIAALEAAPDSREVKQSLAELWLRQGKTALREGNLFVAGNLAKKATELLPEEVDYQLFFGTILIRQSDFYYARHVLEEVLALDPENVTAHQLLGNVSYQAGFLDQALFHWEKIPEDSPHFPMLKRKIEKTKAEINLQGDFGQEVSRNFTLLYDGPMPMAVTHSILAQLEKAYLILARELGSSPLGDIIVILYARIDFHRITGWPRWAGGIFDGKIRIPVKGLSTERDAAVLDPILRHELTHAFLRSFVERRLPLWFEEGLAEYFERLGWVDNERRILRRQHESFPTLTHINKALRGGGESVEAAYDAASEVVSALITERGFPVIVDMLDEMGGGMTFEQALWEEAELSLDDLYRLWMGHKKE